MDSLYLLLLSLSAAGLVTWRLLIGSTHERRHERNVAGSMTEIPGSGTSRAALPRGRYAAVTLRICNRPCAAAVDMQAKTFLVAEAPALPLPGCSHRCNCRYASAPDRRNENRRAVAEDVIEINGPVAVQDNRTGRDRRRKQTPEPYQGIY